MVYVADYARSWSPRRKTKAIERSVDQALRDVAAAERNERAERAALVVQAKAAVSALPESHFEALAAKHGITARAAQGSLMSMAIGCPELVIEACRNTMAKLSPETGR